MSPRRMLLPLELLIRKRTAPKVVAGGMTALLVFFIGAFSFGVLGRLHTIQDGLEQTRSRLRALRDVKLALLEYEGAQRGYILTGDDSYRVPVASTERVLNAALGNLRASRMAGANFAQRVDKLSDSVQLVIGELQAAEKLRDTQSFGAAVLRVRSGIGKELMDDLSRMIDDMGEEERLHRITSEAEQRSWQRLAEFVTGFGSLVAFLMVATVTTWISRSMYRAEIDRVTIEDQARRLEISNAELDKFAYVASHDLRAPLRGIASLSEWIEEDIGAASTKEMQENFAKLRRRVMRLEALIDGILHYARAGRVNAKIEQVDVHAMLRDIVDLLAPADDIAIQVVGDSVVLELERVPIEQVAMNLISNAIKHGCRGGGVISVHVEDGADYLQLSVSDQGPGIDPLFHGKIFGIFQTLESRDRVEGSGIGLALVKKHVEHRGGRIWLESNPGQGARFIFTWPKRTHSAAT